MVDSNKRKNYVTRLLGRLKRLNLALLAAYWGGIIGLVKKDGGWVMDRKWKEGGKMCPCVDWQARKGKGEQLFGALF